VFLTHFVRSGRFFKFASLLQRFIRQYIAVSRSTTTLKLSSAAGCHVVTRKLVDQVVCTEFGANGQQLLRPSLPRVRGELNRDSAQAALLALSYACRDVL